MTPVHAKEIAKLIYKRNKLPNCYTAEDILRDASHYEYEVRKEEVVPASSGRKSSGPNGRSVIFPCRRRE